MIKMPVEYDSIQLETADDNQLFGLYADNPGNFSYIYRKYIKKIYKYCYYKLGCNKENTEDIVSQTFVNALENMSKFVPNAENKDCMLPWLYTIARNNVFQYFRKKSTKDANLWDNEGMEDITDAEIADLDKEIDMEAKVEDVNAVLSKLDNDASEIMFLKINEQMTFIEIADMLGQNEGAVKMKYYRALNYVTNCLIKH